MTTDLDALRAGKRRTLAQTLSLLASDHPKHRQQAVQLLQALPPVPNTLRLGITGATGAGKSTLVQALGKRLCKHSPVAVLAVDPTSPRTGGSILGDKIRMQEFANQPNVYVRPLPSSIAAGRLADMIKVCEFAGFPLTIIETVGAGQTEYQVRNIVDVLVNVISPSSGDSVQCMKKGLHELTDIFVVNRHDGTHSQAAKFLADSLVSVLNLSVSAAPPVLLVSARDATGIDTLEKAIDQKRGDFTAERLEQEYSLWQDELQRLLRHNLPTLLPDLVPQLQAAEEQVCTGKLSATLAVEKILARLRTR